MLGITNFIWCQIVVRIFSRKEEITYSDRTQKPVKEKFEQIREIYWKIYSSPPNSNISKMPGKGDKKPPAMGEGAMGTAHEARQATWDQSWERAAVMDKLIVDALARNTAMLTAKFTALLSERVTVSMPTAL